MAPTDLALLLGSTLRLVRLVTTDDLGEWYLRTPAGMWAMRRGEQEIPLLHLHPQNLVAGLDCPHCVGFWLGAVNLLALLATGSTPRLRAVWRFGAGALALSYLTGHLSARLDPDPDPDPDPR